MKKFILICICCLTFTCITSASEYGDFENVEYVKNYDGDTITVNIDGIHPLIGLSIGIRVRGIDTPELKSDCPNEKILAFEAKLFIEKLFKKGKVITLKNVDRDKYFRILADVYVDNINIADELIKNKMAVKYDGGTKTDWCKE